MGEPELARDPRYIDHISRGKHQLELDQHIEAWTLTLTVDELEALMIEAKVPAGKIYRAPEMLADPHFAARESLIEVDHPRWGKMKMQNVFPKLSKTPGSVRTLASQTVGEDGDAILGERLGLTAADLEALRARGVI
jgi:formyl-CoA transferase